VDTGEILSMVSWPSISAGDAMDGPERMARAPAVNRAIDAPYPPGSIIKPIVYVSAVRSGAISPDEEIACNGHFFGADVAYGRCWIYRPQYKFLTHSTQISGPLNVEAAISRSCNIYFYTLAQRMGLASLTDWYRSFGLGQKLDIGIARREVQRDRGRCVAHGSRRYLDAKLPFPHERRLRLLPARRPVQPAQMPAYETDGVELPDSFLPAADLGR
jgi:cell division protein FtsI/penicillin-binding protein 2